MFFSAVFLVCLKLVRMPCYAMYSWCFLWCWSNSHFCGKKRWSMCMQMIWIHALWTILKEILFSTSSIEKSWYVYSLTESIVNLCAHNNTCTCMLLNNGGVIWQLFISILFVFFEINIDIMKVNSISILFTCSTSFKSLGILIIIWFL